MAPRVVGDWTTALALLDRAIILDPFDVAVRRSRGVALCAWDAPRKRVPSRTPRFACERNSIFSIKHGHD